MSMQYQGGCDYAGVGIALTSATLRLTRRPIIPELVWGKGWKTNYAAGHFEPTVSLNFPLFTNYVATIKATTVDPLTRDTPFACDVDNGGVRASFTGCKPDTWTIRADSLSSAPLECTLGVIGANVSTAAGGSGSAFNATQNTGSTPIPSYLVVANSSMAPSNIITALDINIASNPFRLYTLNGSIFPVAIQLGLMVVNGTFTYYTGGVTGDKTIQTDTDLVLTGPLPLAMASCLVTDISDDIQGPNRKPMRVVSFEAIGTPTDPPIL